MRNTPEICRNGITLFGIAHSAEDQDATGAPTPLPFRAPVVSARLPDVKPPC